MRKHGIAAWCLMLALFVAGPALALDLNEAKESGLVGEQSNGYVGSVAAKPDAAVAKLVADVNAKRKAAYKRIAEKNGTKLAAVASLAAEKLIAKTPPGQYVKAGNTWVKKGSP